MKFQATKFVGHYVVNRLKGLYGQAIGMRVPLETETESRVVVRWTHRNREEIIPFMDVEPYSALEISEESNEDSD